MNKKEWLKQNQKLVAKGQTKADTDDMKKLFKNRGIKLVKASPKDKGAKQYAKDHQISIKNDTKFEKDMLNAYESQKMHVTLDFQVIDKKEPVADSSIAVALFKPQLNISVGQKEKTDGMSRTIWYKNVYVIDPSVTAPFKTTTDYLKSTRICNVYCQQAVRLISKYMKIPNNHRELYWDGHCYVNKD